MNINEKFSDNLMSCLREANKMAVKMNYKQVPINIFLVALFSQKGSLAYDFLAQQKIQLADIRKILLDKVHQNKKPKSEIKSINDLLLKSIQMARRYQHFHLGTEHCLFVLLENPPHELDYLIKLYRLPLKKMQTQLESLLKGNSKFPDLTRALGGNMEETPMDTGEFEDHPEQQNVIDHFSTNLTDENFQKNINPVINRDDELERLIHIVSRKDKNNPIILGDAGVGKTALVEGLAKKILNGDVPHILKNKKILSLDLGSMIAGTMYRGDFENRLKVIVDEVKNDPDVIVFIDEIHNIVGAGSSQGTMDAANLLKPLLARGELRCIGATTHEEYKKFIEKDPALERRFQVVNLREPSPAETRSILDGIVGNYEKFHHVKFSTEALQSAIDLSVQYIQDKLLPDKAIDLIDEAAAAKKINRQNSKDFNDLHLTEQQIKELKLQKKQAIEVEDFNLAIKIKKQEKALTDNFVGQKDSVFLNLAQQPPIISAEDIQSVVAKKTRIPLADLQLSKIGRLKKTHVKLKKDIMGQDQAIEAIMAQLRRSYSGLTDENRPLGSFLFLGPSGVGKTFTAKKLAQEVFGDPEAFVRIDMSEFGEKFNASKLIGAPAGYVGYREGNKLTDSVKKRPFSLVLFDEIEKAHADVLNLLLQLLEEGHLTDATGKKINFKNTIIVMTSNIGLRKFDKNTSLGFGRDDNQENLHESVMEEVKRAFRPEFLNRIDNTIFFNHLDKAAIKKILRLNIKSKLNKLEKNGLIVGFDTNLIENMAEDCLKMNLGARSVEKILTKHLDEQIQKIIASK
ncbi:ATP-dependent Clp protease ATP-binding subunit ClpC [Candidatus Falkowbacteria bacterium CG10_big_fil_rev_8_21_14_0_10_39_11]|uniref:ATP-dependent Clp protease ATP-binding subunit ClpC n=1 Tax=Candidatus Falkowbacteria bacterium CG10_big_fil_rev_8_21_14_0_10_39_11 TaxID=1974565 RepID=A0A2H0V602_9BACT|nr:MAG: ATP-dependent Clp protease ATP-binding subunit ClpC [Candidatus Falkowbacteria bacterium CG10_big_fil_rev_8_21_14_0_10_39_11]